MQSFEEIKTEITEFINGPRLNTIFEGSASIVKEIMEKMFYCAEILYKDEKIKEDDDKVITELDLTKMTDLVMFNTLERQTSEDDIKILKSMSMFLYNYNQNTLKLESISIRVSFLTNFLDGFLSFRDCIHLFKSLSERLRTYQSFNPPSFELSKHYIDTIFSCSDKDVKDKE